MLVCELTTLTNQLLEFSCYHEDIRYPLPVVIFIFSSYSLAGIALAVLHGCKITSSFFVVSFVLLTEMDKIKNIITENHDIRIILKLT